MTFGQKKSIRVPSCVDLFYGSRLIQGNFYNQLNTKNDFDINRPMTIVGVGVSEHTRSPKGGNMVNQLYYTQIIPQPIVIQDSINCKIKGFYASINVGHHLLRTNHFILFFGIGANGGRLQLFDKGNINKTTRILTPKVFLTPLVYFGRITFSFSIEYDYDLFHYPWKNRKSAKQNDFFPIHIKQTCLTGLVKLGFALGK